MEEDSCESGVLGSAPRKTGKAVEHRITQGTRRRTLAQSHQGVLVKVTPLSRLGQEPAAGVLMPQHPSITRKRVGGGG